VVPFLVFPHLNLFPIRATRPNHLVLDLISRIVRGKEYRLQSSSLCSLLHSPVTSSLLGPNILLVLYRVTEFLRSAHTGWATGQLRKFLNKYIFLFWRLLNISCSFRQCFMTSTKKIAWLFIYFIHLTILNNSNKKVFLKRNKCL
jgi:hypothetical protein